MKAVMYGAGSIWPWLLLAHLFSEIGYEVVFLSM